MVELPAPGPQKESFLPNVVAGALGALVTLAYAGSFGQLIFEGALAPFVGRGILIALVSSIVVMMVLSWRSSFPFAMGGPDANPSAVLAVTLASLAGEVVAATGPNSPELLPTILMFTFLSAIGCGLIVWLLGKQGGGAMSATFLIRWWEASSPARDSCWWPAPSRR